MPRENIIKRLEERQSTKRDIVLPNVIPWEYGSNKFASQKGTGGLGRNRSNTIDIVCTRELTNSHNGNVPFHICPPLKKSLASQAGQAPFGAFREQVLWVREHNDEGKKTCREMLTDWKATERSMPLLMKSNPNAKNDKIGKLRETIATSIGGYQMSYQDQLKCRAALPRFQDMDQVKAIKDSKENGNEKMVGGLHHNRQIVTNIVGLDRTEQDQLDSNRYLAWLGGQLTLQSQTHTGGFSKVRDVANQSYYDKILPDQGLSKEELEERKLKKRQELKEQLGLVVSREVDVDDDNDESVETTIRLGPSQDATSDKKKDDDNSCDKEEVNKEEQYEDDEVSDEEVSDEEDYEYDD